MDPLSALQSRLEILEARLGISTEDDYIPNNQDADPVATSESVAELLLAATSCINTATAGQGKLTADMQRASEVTNFTDPNFIKNIQQSETRLEEILASEPEFKQHYQSMKVYEKVVPVLDSAHLQATPQLLPHLQKLQVEATQLHKNANEVSVGVQRIAETCGQAAGSATRSLLDIARKVEAVENKLNPNRRNEFD